MWNRHKRPPKPLIWVGAACLLGTGALGVLSAQSFNEIPINGGNSFNTTWESFDTSTPQADTPYVSYASWDDTWIYLGMTGSDIGDGDCSDPSAQECFVFETGQSQDKYLVYYLDVDPSKDAGATQAKDLSGSGQGWSFPEGMRPDYMVQIRTDGQNAQTGAYTGESFLYKYDGASWTEVTGASGPEGGSDFLIWDNNGSNFLELALRRDALEPPSQLETRRSPSQLGVMGWMTHTKDLPATTEDDRISYAYWPATAAPVMALDEQGTTSGMVMLQDYYGFVLDDAQLPNASKGQANLNRRFTQNWDCPSAFPGDVGQEMGQGNAFHTIAITGSNGFNSAKESFPTSTSAATGYTAYATWDRSMLYLGYTGSDIGGGDCGDPTGATCETFELGQSPKKWLMYFFDTDPTGSEGTTDASLPMELGENSPTHTLPFAADYAVFIRTDGASADASPYTGTAALYRHEGGSWKSMGPCGLQVYDNNGSGFLEFAVDLSAMGSPVAVRTASWILDAERGNSYAFWPEDATAAVDAKGVVSGDATLSESWSFELVDGVIPNASGNKSASFGELAKNQLTPSTYEIDGETGPKERLPKHSLGRENPDAPELAMSWDGTNLYLSLSNGPLLEEDAALYVAFDENPSLGMDPREGMGSMEEPAVGAAAGDANAPVYPFAADRVIRIAGTDTEDTQDADAGDVAKGYTWSGGAWMETALSGAKIRRVKEGKPTEIAIPWSALNVGADAKFHMLVYLSRQGSGIPAQWPASNPQGQSPELTDFLTFWRKEGVEPFSRAHLSTRIDQGSTLSGALYNSVYLVVPDPAGNTATFSLSQNTTVVGELYVGRSATLDFGANQENPEGRNALRVGEQLTARGTLEGRGAVVYTFDPAKGFPQEQEVGGGFAAPSLKTTFKCVSGSGPLGPLQRHDARIVHVTARSFDFMHETQ